MKTCPKCNKELKDTAKFCGGCGYKFPAADDAPKAGPTCPECGNVLKPGAKFCGKCGTKLAATPTPEAAKDGAQQKDLARVGSGGFIRWTMLPGQVAVRISEEEIEACGKVKGIAIQDGTKALFFVNGKLVAELGAGSYAFKELKKGEGEKKPEAPEERRAGGFWGFLRNTCEAAGRAIGRVFQSVSQAASGEKPAISVVLVRSTDFPLVFSIKDANTSGVRSDVGLHMICKVTNINEFYKNLLLDKKFVCFDEMQKALAVVVKNTVNVAVASFTPDRVGNNPALEANVLTQLQAAVTGIYPFVEVKKVLQLTADNQAIEGLRRMGEELYISEQELSHLQKRNDFLNRLQAVKNEQELKEEATANAHELRKLDQANAHDIAMAGAQQSHELKRDCMDADFEAGKLKIYEEMQLTADERAKFDMMLTAQRTIREAKSEDEMAAALHEFEKSGLFRAEELDNIKHQIAQNARIRDLNDAQAIAVLTMQNEQSLEQQKLDWEILMGNKKLDDEIARNRKVDAYNDERRDAEDAYRDSRREKDAAFQDARRDSDAAYQDSRRQADLNFDKQEQQQQMEMLRQAQALRMEREDAEHRRSMESADAQHRHTLEAENAARAHEEVMQKVQLDAQVESKRIYAGMSFEQIMAANPDLTPEAAQALAKKFEAEAAAAQNDKTNELLRQQNEQTAELMRQQVEMANQNKGDMMAFMQQMMQQQNAVNLKQMEMMRDTSAAFAGQRIQQQQDAMRLHDQEIALAHKDESIARQNEELERQRRDADRNQDRMLAGVQSTVTAAGTAFSGRAQGGQQPQRRKDPPPAATATAPAATSAAPSAVPKCPQCGAELEPDSSFCGECGAAL